MKKIILLLLLVVPFSVFSFNSDSLRTKKIQIGVTFSPDFCFRKLKATTDSKWIADGRDSLEIPKFGYTAGISLEYKVNTKLFLSSGILFSDCGEKTKEYSVDNVTFGQEATKYSFKYHYYYLNIPVKANYFIVNRKIKFYLTAGLSANIFLYQKTTFLTHHQNSDKKASTKSNNGFAPLNFSALIGCGINYPISPKTKLLIEPIYRRSINSIIDAPVKSYLYSIGMNVGILFNL